MIYVFNKPLWLSFPPSPHFTSLFLTAAVRKATAWEVESAKHSVPSRWDYNCRVIPAEMAFCFGCFALVTHCIFIKTFCKVVQLCSNLILKGCKVAMPQSKILTQNIKHQEKDTASSIVEATTKNLLTESDCCGLHEVLSKAFKL